MSASASTAHQPCNNNAAAPTALDKSDDEEHIDFTKLHPSVRFCRGMWKLCQLSTEDSSSSFPTLQAADKTVDGLSVVALHQRLLPPAPVNGLGEIADESYAAQLATSDGIEFLRVHWHLLLPLLFPSCRQPCLVQEGEDSAKATQQKSNDEDSSTYTAGATKAGPLDVDVAPETQWTAEELYRRLQCPLSEVDLKVIRDPGHMDRIYYSYIVLLRFFGWRVHDEERGLLDRNRAWAERYALLERYRLHGVLDICGDELTSSPTQLPSSPNYDSFDFYSDGLPRVLRGLLDVGFLRLAVRLVEFVMEEIKSGRLQFLLSLVEGTLLPLVVEHPNVEVSHKTRLQKQLYRLTHSDSD